MRMPLSDFFPLVFAACPTVCIAALCIRGRGEITHVQLFAGSSVPQSTPPAKELAACFS